MECTAKLTFHWIYFTILFVLGTYCIPHLNPVTKDCNIKDFDRCGAVMSTFRVNGEVPNSIQKSQALCENYNKSAECILDYAGRCAEPLAEQLVRIGMDNLMKVIKAKCTERELELYHKLHTKCVQDHIITLERCINKTLVRLEDATENRPPYDFIPIACCCLADLETCVLTDLPKTCHKETLEYISEIVNGAAVDLRDLMCVDYTSSSSYCIDLAKQGHPDIETKKYLSVFPTLLNIARSFRQG